MSIQITEQLNIREERIPDHANIEDFLNENKIQNITFIFAHPDDIDGYAGGLVHNLMQVNTSKILAGENPVNIQFLIATDGANGTKDGNGDRKLLIEQRKAEQLTSLRHLGFEDAKNHIKFLEIRDGELSSNQDDLERYLSSTLEESSVDLIITHDSRAWGNPKHLVDPYSAVQNHPDHRAASRAVRNAVNKTTNHKPIILEATWDRDEAIVTSTFDPDFKQGLFEDHPSQYAENKAAMDSIPDLLNNLGDEKRHEFFRIVNLNARKALIAQAGRIMRDLIYRTKENRSTVSLETALIDNNVSSVLFLAEDEDDLIQTHGEMIYLIHLHNEKNPTKIINLHYEYASEHSDFNEFHISGVSRSRRHNVDLIIPTANRFAIESADQILMFDAGLSHIETPGHNLRHIQIMAYVNEEGNVRAGKTVYSFMRGIW